MLYALHQLSSLKADCLKKRSTFQNQFTIHINELYVGKVANK